MTEIIVRLSSELQQKFGSSGPSLLELGNTQLPNITLSPNDSETADSEMRCYYTIATENDSEAAELVEELLKLSGVEAAWIKPIDAPPN